MRRGTNVLIGSILLWIVSYWTVVGGHLLGWADATLREATGLWMLIIAYWLISSITSGKKDDHEA